MIALTLGILCQPFMFYLFIILPACSQQGSMENLLLWIYDLQVTETKE